MQDNTSKIDPLPGGSKKKLNVLVPPHPQTKVRMSQESKKMNYQDLSSVSILCVRKN